MVVYNEQLVLVDAGGALRAYSMEGKCMLLRTITAPPTKTKKVPVVNMLLVPNMFGLCVTCDSDGAIKLWDIVEGSSCVYLLDADTCTFYR
jgi:hypothetical protein